MVNPALLSQLGHDGIDPGKTGLSLSPLGQGLWVLVPGNTHTDWVALHLVEPWICGSSGVEKLPP